MEVAIFGAVVVVVLVYMLWRSRRGGDAEAYVVGEERLQTELAVDEANLRAALYPGPGGPMEGGGGTNATFGP